MITLYQACVPVASLHLTLFMCPVSCLWPDTHIAHCLWDRGGRPFYLYFQSCSWSIVIVQSYHFYIGYTFIPSVPDRQPLIITQPVYIWSDGWVGKAAPNAWFYRCTHTYTESTCSYKLSAGQMPIASVMHRGTELV